MEFPHYTTETYKGIDIDIYYDQDSMNPFKDWDECMPLIYKGNQTGEDFSNGEILDYLRNFLSYNQVRRHQTRILELIGEDLEEFREDYPTDEYDRTEMIKDDILYSWLDDGLNNMVEFCKEFGIKHYNSTSKGYSQGDWADVFICWTPEFEEITGRSYESIEESDFKGAFDLFTAWAWGDVFYFVVEETGDSCGGFYGDDFEENGLMENAKSDIDYFLKKKKETKQKRLKELVKNKVPYSNREEILVKL